LRPADDAIIVDSTGLDIDEVVAVIVGHFEQSSGGQHD
jgi:cytidylate kinase